MAVQKKSSDVLTTHGPLTTSNPYHIGTNPLIYKANQLTGFCMMGNIGR